MENDIFDAAVAAAAELALTPQSKIDSVLETASRLIIEKADMLLAANAEDLGAMAHDNPMRDRLLLDARRIESIAEDMRHVARLASPVGEIIEKRQMPNSMTISKVRVPLGVVGVIYEARPNVTFDVFSLCLKTANACILKGGSDAIRTNTAAISIIRQALSQCGITPDAATLLGAGRQCADALLRAVGKVDVVIPRGSASLIRHVRENSLVPVIETGAGVVHTFVDKDADTDTGRRIILNAKTRRVSVCNALDCLIIHRDRLGDLPSLCEPLTAKGVEIYADTDALDALDGSYPSSLLHPSDSSCYGREFLDYKMAVKTVSSLEEALQHIALYSSRHSEAIVTENSRTAERFTRSVDAACVYVNVSTAFTDGGQFGMGAEVGISTQKLHARGPMGLHALTSYKYIITGSGQTRE